MHEEKALLFCYLSKSKEPLLKVVKGSGLVMASESKRDFMQHRQTERFTRYSQKALHGYFV